MANTSIDFTEYKHRWIYNCKDGMYTLEVLEGLQQILDCQPDKLQELYRFQIDQLYPALIATMNKGILVDTTRKDQLYKFFHSLMDDIKLRINDMLGMEFNINSSPQKVKLFRDFLGIKLKTKKGSVTCDAAATLQYIEEYPEYRPFLTLLLEYASLKVVTTTFLGMKLDSDNRARTQYGLTSTGRLNSRKNVWGTGGNLQNIPEKGKINLKYALQVLDESGEEDDSDFDIEIYNEVNVEGSIRLPNVKKIFLPDTGKELADLDYSGADIMIVAADSGCKWLLDFFANPKGKVYRYIANTFFQREIEDWEYKVYKGIFHGSNYGMGIEKLAKMAGISYNIASQLQEYYFHLNPEVRIWQEGISKDIAKYGYITNVFGRKAWFTNKNDPTLLNKALAFKPQGGIADLINHAWVDIRSKYKTDIDVIAQVHDSLVCQYDIDKANWARKVLLSAMEIPLVFPSTTLIIPADIKVSIVSYGDTSKPKKVIG